MKRILVTGAGGPASVNFIKSLRAAPEKFFIVGTDINKYRLELPDVDKRYLVPGNTEKNYIEVLNKIIEMNDVDIVHPQPDTEVRFISENREKINTRVFLPKKEVVRICQDKLKSALVWKKAGVPVPISMKVDNEDDIKDAGKEFGFPFWLRATQGAGARGSTPVENLDVGISWFRYWRARGKEWQFMAQEYLPGQNIAFQSVWLDGDIVCSQARERVEYIYPYLAPSGITGTPAVAKTIADHEINEIATKAVRSIDPGATGIFCVDLKRNKGGVPCPTEINTGRFFTTSFFFTKAGVNMPYIYVKLAFGERIPRLKKYDTIDEGVYWIRHMDSGPKLIVEGGWTSEKIG
jgi:biotin carboxylase